MTAKAPWVAVTPADYLYFTDRAVRGMSAILGRLGDELACSRPAVPGANTPYGLLTHCLAVIEYWAGHVVAGRSVTRDRSAEFEATGTVAELQQRVEEVLLRLAKDLTSVEGTAPLRNQPAPWTQGPDRPLTQAAALMHVYEEMAQHHGQLEIMRDLLLAERQLPEHRLPGPPERGPAELRPVHHGPVEGRGPQSNSGPFDAPMDWLRAKRGVKWQRPGPDVLPAWVADMDFPVAEPIRAAILGTLDRGDLGYPDWPVHPLCEAFAERMAGRYGWQPDPSSVRGVNDLIQALQISLQLGTRPGQAVLAHTPNYPPFLATVHSMGRRLIGARLVPQGRTWNWDDDRLHAEAAGADPALLLLVNPHNPTGRVFTRAELERVADIAERYDLLVVSDEIHAELVHEPHRHIPFASLSPATAARTVTVTSATKAFNIAGVRTAVAHVGPPELRAAWDSQPPDLFGAANVLGVEATLAAWRHGEDWLAGVRAQLRARRDELTQRIGDLPGISMLPPEAGYLAWLDCRAAKLPLEPADYFGQAGVYLSPGTDFGPGNHGYARLNFATTAAVLDQLLTRIATALPG